jgi:Ni,Fe-hydrogenase maturation factor
MKKILIGTVGYHNLGNHSLGPALLPMLEKMSWPRNVEVEEMNWGPIAIVQKFQTLDIPYDRVVLLAAIERPGRNIGDVDVFRWMGRLPDEEMIQACVGDAVTGVISVENLLIIGEHFKIWPAETFIVDVEPGPEKAGVEFTNEVQGAVPIIIDTIRQLCVAGNAAVMVYDEIYGDTLTDAR